MKYQIICDPTYSAVEVSLDAGERIVAESGAMAWMTANIQTETSTRGGIMAGMKRKLLSGESFFQNTYYPEGGPGSDHLCARIGRRHRRPRTEQWRTAARERAPTWPPAKGSLRFQVGRAARVLQRGHVRAARDRDRYALLPRLR